MWTSAEAEGFRDGEIDFQGGQQGLGGLVVELEALHELDVADAWRLPR
jgi:hypothetical protein